MEAMLSTGIQIATSAYEHHTIVTKHMYSLHTWLCYIMNHVGGGGGGRGHIFSNV